MDIVDVEGQALEKRITQEVNASYDAAIRFDISKAGGKKGAVLEASVKVCFFLWRFTRVPMESLD